MPIIRKPDWLKIKLATDESYSEVGELIKKHGLHTICSSGQCPNRIECWNRGTATFMILGEICTRSCKFCATMSGRPLQADVDEPEKLARSISKMRLNHCVITSVTRDDLSDQGAAHWAATVRAVKRLNPTTTVEILIPDMDSNGDLLDIIIDSKPDIVAHNIETVERLTPTVRSKAKYRVSLSTLNYLFRKGCKVKSGMMLGLGESESEILQTMDDLLYNGCSILTIGQYLRPSLKHIEVAEYITPKKFEEYRQVALNKGFTYVESGPLVRSSYMADKAIHSVREDLT